MPKRQSGGGISPTCSLMAFSISLSSDMPAGSQGREQRRPRSCPIPPQPGEQGAQRSGPRVPGRRAAAAPRDLRGRGPRRRLPLRQAVSGWRRQQQRPPEQVFVLGPARPPPGLIPGRGRQGSRGRARRGRP